MAINDLIRPQRVKFDMSEINIGSIIFNRVRLAYFFDQLRKVCCDRYIQINFIAKIIAQLYLNPKQKSFMRIRYLTG